MERPQADEFGAFYKGYIDAVDDDVIAEINQQRISLPELMRANASKADFAYAEGKWTLKELLGHIIDTERIVAYRLLRISRNDITPLPGFEENAYVEFSGHRNADFEKLIQEFEVVRKSTLFLIDSLSEEQLNYRGTASGHPVSGRALVFIIAGHLKHHVGVVRERYL
jgi:hypothetical protein